MEQLRPSKLCEMLNQEHGIWTQNAHPAFLLDPEPAGGGLEGHDRLPEVGVLFRIVRQAVEVLRRFSSVKYEHIKWHHVPSSEPVVGEKLINETTRTWAAANMVNGESIKNTTQPIINGDRLSPFRRLTPLRFLGTKLCYDAEAPLLDYTLSSFGGKYNMPVRSGYIV